VYVVTSADAVKAVDAATGDVRWSRVLGGCAGCDEHSSPTVANGRVFVDGADALTALDAATGDVLWTTHHGAGEGGAIAPAVAAGRVFVSAADTRVYAYVASTGAPLWHSQALGERSPLAICPPAWFSVLPSGLATSAPTVAGGVVYLGSDDGIYLFAKGCPTTACAPFAQLLAGRNAGAVAVADGRAYSAVDGFATALRTG
jgi:outer membrane protein assembly factor BamB